MLVDSQIIEYGEKLLIPFNKDNVYNIGYDLTTEEYCISPSEIKKEISLSPGESVFVKTQEEIILSNYLCAKIVLRNSRIRQGLDLTAPFYQPGHHTKIFFRITNISKQVIHLDCESGLASIMFEKLDHPPNYPYDGTFQKEFDFRGMGKYTSDFSNNMTNIEKKVDNMRHIEQTIYGNILSLMAIFIGIFSLINLNVTLSLQTNIAMKTLLTLNFTTIGSIGFLIAIINTILPNGKHRIPIWITCFLSFIVAVSLQFILK